MKVLLYGLGIAMFFEGIPYFVAPKRSKTMMRAVLDMPDNVLRGLGGVLLLIGFSLLYFI